MFMARKLLNRASQADTLSSWRIRTSVMFNGSCNEFEIKFTFGDQTRGSRPIECKSMYLYFLFDYFQEITVERGSKILESKNTKVTFSSNSVNVSF